MARVTWLRVCLYEMIGLLFGLLAAVVGKVGKVWESWVGKLGIELTQGRR